ncbi:MAG: DUF308 domain-containing protein [Anaerolineae bacterium]
MLKNSPWWLALIQGLVAVGAGLFLLVDPTAATFLVGLLAAIYLLVTGLIYTVRGIIVRRPGKSSLLLIRGIVGLVFGAVLLAMALFNIGDVGLGYTILAIGLVVFGGMGLFSSLFHREGKPFAWGPVIVSGALLAWGLIILFCPLDHQPAGRQRLDSGAHRRGDHRLHVAGPQGPRQRSGLRIDSR